MIKLMYSHIEDDRKNLRASLPAIDTFPTPVKIALHDMVYQQGIGNLKRKFRKLIAAANKQDWCEAANQCNRPIVSAKRNNATRTLFLKVGDCAS